MDVAPNVVRRIACCCWPGLAQLWFRGCPIGLSLAIAFSLLVNAAVLVSLAWTEVAPPWAVGVLWSVVGAFWLLSAWRNHAWLVGQTARSDRSQRVDLYPEAMTEYLKGDWFATEAICRRMLAIDENDVEARLLLATVSRHAKRFNEAYERLDDLTRYSAAEKWRHEIEAERELLAVAVAEAETAVEDDAGESYRQAA